ncbi:hypothetical protein AgCh_031972 [Apium graveolens]
MSDEEHKFESKDDADASKTYPQQGGTIHKDSQSSVQNSVISEYTYMILLEAEKGIKGKTNSAEKGKGKKGMSHSSEKKENKIKLLCVRGQIMTCLDLEVEEKVKQIQAEV